MKFRELKVGDKFCFKSSFDFRGEQEIREKVSWSKYRDVSNYGEPGFPTIKKVSSRETSVIKID